METLTFMTYGTRKSGVLLGGRKVAERIIKAGMLNVEKATGESGSCNVVDSPV